MGYIIVGLKRKGGRYCGPISPRVTLTAQKKITMNRPAYLLLGSPKAVLLMFDKERAAIGIKPADRGAENVRLISRHGRRGFYAVRGITFFKFFGIEYGERQTFIPTVEDGVLVCELQAD